MCVGSYSNQSEATPESIESQNQLIKQVKLGVVPAWNKNLQANRPSAEKLRHRCSKILVCSNHILSVSDQKSKWA